MTRNHDEIDRLGILEPSESYPPKLWDLGGQNNRMRRTLEILNELEQNGTMSRYAIGGAMGATFYVEPLLTFDLEILVLLPQTGGGQLTLAGIYDALRAKGYREEDECVLIEGVPVQFLPAYNELLEEALQEARDILYEGTANARAASGGIWLPSVYKPAGIRIESERELLPEEQAGFGPELSSRGVSPAWPGRKMERMDRLNPEIARLFAAKQRRRPGPGYTAIPGEGTGRTA